MVLLDDLSLPVLPLAGVLAALAFADEGHLNPSGARVCRFGDENLLSFLDIGQEANAQLGLARARREELRVWCVVVTREGHHAVFAVQARQACRHFLLR